MKELFEAVRAGDQVRVKELVAANPQLAIFAASILGDVDELDALLTANRSLVGLLSEDGWTPLHLSAFFGKTEAARLLLNKGALVNAKSTNPMQNMPLHAAAAGRHLELVNLLIEHGAPVNARQHGGWSPLHAAAQNGDIEISQSPGRRRRRRQRQSGKQPNAPGSGPEQRPASHGRLPGIQRSQTVVRENRGTLRVLCSA